MVRDESMECIRARTPGRQLFKAEGLNREQAAVLGQRDGET